MLALIQRVKKASVLIDEKLYSSIQKGILVFLGIEQNDDTEQVQKLAEKILKFRIFSDKSKKMNFSVSDIGGEILVISQFTLCANCKKGTRPSFDNSASPDKALKLYENFVQCIKQSKLNVQTGKFGAMMNVELVNDGPVTFLLKK